MRGRWRHPGAVPHVAALMRATGVLAETAEDKKKRPISSYAIALPRAGRGDDVAPSSSDMIRISKLLNQSLIREAR
jgi:hypothetical protein